MTSATPPYLQASIHIGASSISMLVVENRAGNEGDAASRPGEFLEQSLPLARDIFQRGSIRRSTIEQCVKILKGYQQALRELGATDETPIRAVGTNILIEASNHDAFLNRIQIGCGMQIDTLDDGEMTRLIYLKTRRRLLDTPSMKTRTTLVVHAGPGNTRALLFKKGRISDYTNYRLGVYRTNEAISGNELSGPQLRKIIREHIGSLVNQIHHNYHDAGIEELVIIGYEIQDLATALVKPGKTKSTPQALAELTSEIVAMSEEARVKKFRLDYATAQAVVPALEINLAIAESLDVDTLRLPGSDYERGLLVDLPATFSLTASFQEEVVRSAEGLALKYKVHQAHAHQVARLSETLFEQTKALHQLGEHDALLLKCAALVHECGNFVSVRAHHKHSHYIIQHSEIFGLGQRDISIIALIARYHRKSGPKSTHAGYRSLSSTDRMRVSKLAAILRVADALDRSHSNRIGQISISVVKQKLAIELKGIADASSERLSMAPKANLFHDIFGLRVTLIEGH